MAEETDAVLTVPRVPPPEPPAHLGPDDFLFDPHSVTLFQVRDIVSLSPGLRVRNPDTQLTLANGRKLTIRKPLSLILPRLPKFFFLVRRGWAINLYHIRDMVPWGRKNLNVTLSDLTQVLISRKQLVALCRLRGL